MIGKFQQLVDRFGRLIKKEDLLTEQATPTTTGVRSILSGHPTTKLTPRRMADIILRAEEGDAQAYLEMAEEIEEKDPHYLAVLGTRKRAVAQMEVTVESASDNPEHEADARLIRDWIRRDQFEAEIIDILDAIGKGFSVTELIWRRGDKWLPEKLIWRNPAWFQFDRVNGHTIRLRDPASIDGIDLAPYKYIVHRHAAKSGLTIRGGVVRAVAWMWLFKNFSIKDWVIFVEAYGQPIRLGKYPAGSSQKDRDTLMRAVSRIGSDAAAIIPDSMLIEFVESSGKTMTVDAFEKLCRFCDEQISKAVLGQTTTTDALSTGIAGNASHNDVRGDIARSDAKQLAATINEQLIPMIISLNHGPRNQYPRINIGQPEPVDLDKLSAVADRAVRMGLHVSHKGLMEKLGLPEAQSAEDIVKLPETAAPAMGFTPPFAATARIEAAAAAVRPPDAIDRLADDMAGDWEEIMNPIVAALEEAIQSAESFEDLNARLLDVIARLKMDEATEKIARAIFAARLAGNLDADLGGR